ESHPPACLEPLHSCLDLPSLSCEDYLARATQRCSCYGALRRGRPPRVRRASIPVARRGRQRVALGGSKGHTPETPAQKCFEIPIRLYRHHVHFDVTHERAFTPSPEAQWVVQGLTTDVDLLYFYRIYPTINLWTQM